MSFSLVKLTKLNVIFLLYLFNFLITIMIILTNKMAIVTLKMTIMNMVFKMIIMKVLTLIC